MCSRSPETPRPQALGGLSLALIAVLVGLSQPAFAQSRPEPPATLDVRYESVGLLFVEGTADDCPTARRGGRVEAEGSLRLVESDEQYASYEGRGQAWVDADGCGMTPDRADPGQSVNGSGFGNFSGDNFRGCTVSAQLARHDVALRLEVEYDGAEVAWASFEWEPVGPIPAVRVESECEAAFHAEHVASLEGEFASGGHAELQDYDRLQALFGRGVPETGVYRDVGEDRSWTLVLGDAPR